MRGLRRAFSRFLRKDAESASERERVIRAFSRYAGKTAESASERQRVRGVCLVTQLLNYNELYSVADLEDIAVVMNGYYGIVSRAVMRHDGDVDQFSIGSVITFFGVHRNATEATQNAVNSGLEAYEGLVRHGAFATHLSIAVGIGICGGEMIYGEFGDADRATVTGFGAPINCAGRLSNKSAGINVCETVAKRLPKDLLQGVAVRVCAHEGGES